MRLSDPPDTITAKRSSTSQEPASASPDTTRPSTRVDRREMPWNGTHATRSQIRDAHAGAIVLLDDGSEAALQWLSKHGGKATVRQHGRHLRIDATRIVRVVKRGDQP